jgi:CO dehydrogenase nickel-insertion accessory protein CooC1
MGKRTWQSILENYYNEADSQMLKSIDEKIRLLAMVRFLYLLAATDLKGGELGEKRIRTAQKHITELIEVVDNLNI